MSDPLRHQVTVWWQTIVSEDTFLTYQKALLVTWQILQETVKLLWLFLCLGLVLFNWLFETSTRSGQQLKAWVESIPEPKGEHLWQEVVEKFSDYSRTSTTALIGQARQQLGLPVFPSQPQVAPSAPVARPPSSPAPSPISSPEVPPAATVTPSEET